MEDSSGHAQSGQRPVAPAHLLLVEDVSVTREFLTRLLQECGNRVTAVGTVTEALERLALELPDLVVLDLLLPDFNGVEVCRFLRSQPGGEDTPVLIITVDERPDSHAQALQAGADDFLRKPLLPMELKSRVHSLLRLRDLRKQLRLEREAILKLQAQKNQLVQFLVHDLKNMLTILLCNVDLLESNATPSWDRQRQRIGNTAHTMHSMVQNMLDLTVHEQAGLQPLLETRAVGPWLEGMRPEFEALLRPRRQTLALQMDPGLEWSVDLQMIQRVLINLVENASKYGPPDSEVQVRFRRLGPTLQIQVADRGDGIPESMKQAVFDRFVRLEPGEGPAGRGLGLAFCRMVMDLHGGRIWVEDHPPHGSVFCLEWPAPAEVAEPQNLTLTPARK